MLDAFSAAGLRVHTPFGPRKSGMPESVEMPAPVSTTTRSAAAIAARADASSSVVTVSTSLIVADGEQPRHWADARPGERRRGVDGNRRVRRGLGAGARGQRTRLGVGPGRARRRLLD